MKMADVLHKIADLLDQQGDEESGKVGLTPVNHEPQDDTESVTMVPPLQQKLELLKKATGIDNHFDDEGSDELDDIKKLSGMPATVMHISNDDTDVE